MASVGPHRRHCERCQTEVHDLSTMTAAEAKLVMLRARGAEKICVRYASGPDGRLRFRSPPARTTGPLIAVLAGVVAACTSTGEMMTVEGVDAIDWAEGSSPTIPDRDPDLKVEQEPGFVQDVVVASECSIGPITMTMGAMAPRITMGMPVVPKPQPFEPDGLRRPHNGTRDTHDPSRPRTARQQRRAERKQRRLRRREAREVAKQARKIEREHRRELAEAEREVDRQSRRAERRQRRRARRAERRKLRAQRREARRARREARRAARRGD